MIEKPQVDLGKAGEGISDSSLPGKCITTVATGVLKSGQKEQTLHKISILLCT